MKRAGERVVGATGFEPATPCAQGRCATRLRYAPTLKTLDFTAISRRLSGQVRFAGESSEPPRDPARRSRTSGSVGDGRHSPGEVRGDSPRPAARADVRTSWHARPARAGSELLEFVDHVEDRIGRRLQRAN